jgi:ribosome-binding factor A
MQQKDHKLKEMLRELAAEYFSRTSNRLSMITITNVEILSRGGKAIILMTVLPESMEESALEFAKRQLSNFRDYVKEKSRIGRIPFFEVKIDTGEKNRLRIDEIEKSI